MFETAQTSSTVIGGATLDAAWSMQDGTSTWKHVGCWSFVDLVLRRRRLSALLSLFILVTVM